MKNYNNILIYDLETNGFFSKEGKTQPIELAYLLITPNTLIALLNRQLNMYIQLYVYLLYNTDVVYN